MAIARLKHPATRLIRTNFSFGLEPFASLLKRSTRSGPKYSWNFSVSWPVIYKEGFPLTSLGQMLLSCHNSLYRYARALSHNPSVAEELVQETYMRALGAKRQPEPLTAGSVRAWAFTILRHVWLNTLRNAEHEVIGDLAEPAAESMETLLIRQLLRSEIVHAIDTLPGAYREVIVLREIEGLSYAEIAEVLHCPRGTVMSRLARARCSLRTLLMRFAPSAQEVER